MQLMMESYSSAFFSLVVLSLAATASLIELASIQVFIFAAVLSVVARRLFAAAVAAAVRDSCTRQRVKNNKCFCYNLMRIAVIMHMCIENYR